MYPPREISFAAGKATLQPSGLVERVGTPSLYAKSLKREGQKGVRVGQSEADEGQYGVQ